MTLRAERFPCGGGGRKSEIGGFTLVEILVAMALLMVVVVLLHQVYSSASALWQRSLQRIDAVREARAALDIVARELSMTRLEPNLPTLHFGELFSDPEVPEGLNRQVYALVPLVRNDGNSDLCAVGYYCAWDHEEKAFTLMRHCLGSDATYERLVAATADGTVDPSEIFEPSGLNATGVIQDEVVASHVWDFNVTPIRTDGSRELEYPISYTGDLPPAVEISLKAVSPMATRKFAGQGVMPSWWFDTESAFYRNQILPAQQRFGNQVLLGMASKRTSTP